MLKPSALFIFHLHDAMEMMTKRSMMKSSTMAQKSPLLLTATGAKPWMDECRSHGTGRLSLRKGQTNKHISQLWASLHFFFNRDTSGCRSSPDSDVEDVTAHRARHNHVPQAFTRHSHTGYEVGDGCPYSQDSQAHYLL